MRKGDLFARCVVFGQQRVLLRITISRRIEADVSQKRSNLRFGAATPGTVAVAVIVSLVVSLASATSAHAEQWMFRRSYFSHVPQAGTSVTYPQPESRSAYRRAYVGRGFGFAARSVYRYNTLYLRSGNSQDVTIFREHRFELRPSPWSTP